jgi:SNF2 family DNA or RNA helicase
MSYWRFSLPLGEEDRALLAEIPGAKVSASGVAVPENAAWLIEETLTAMGKTFTVGRPAPRPHRDARLALPWLREWVPAFLTPYQREGVMWALNASGGSGHLWWPTGAGKTLGSIVWALSAGPGVTVATVKASIRRQWSHEVELYSTASVIELEGQKPEEITIVPRLPTFLVISYEILPFWIAEIEKLHPTSVIYDEVHHVKSWRRHDATVTPGGDGTEVTFDLKDNQTAAAYRLSRTAHRRLSTTRTPIKDRPRDLWSQLDLIHPWEFGSFYGPREQRAGFAWRYCAATESPFGGIDTRGRSNLQELKRRLQHVVHTIPYSVTHRDLPAKRRLVTYVAVKDQVRAEGFSKEIKEAMKGVSSGSEGRARLFEIRVMEAAARKRKIVVQHVTECVGANEKVVVFTGRRRDADQLAETFREKLSEVTTWVGHGGHSYDAREEMRVAYMAHPGPCILVGTGEAWGTGLNLQDTDRAIFAMLPYTPGDVVQREGRFARLGQKRPVLIHYLICEGTVDEHVAAILLSKFPAVERVTDFEEVAGLGRELIGASEEELLNSMLDKVLQPEGEAAP